ncbi:S-phase kinase-associated protein 1-like [Oppia nitens]|uniref:S-phase kinase-associated protein 1-like n=1 Tax=Oppia nitens TaxID=1686743 RepID=UPI0023D9FD34|nr:S-phase kinase-associated protein 1-like [Oppia nitens]
MNTSESEEKKNEILIKVISKDGDIRVVKQEMAKMSLTLKDMLDTTGADLSANQQLPLPLNLISTKVLDKIIEYTGYHSEDPIEEKDSDDEEEPEIKKSDDISDWDNNFMKNMDCNTLFDLLLAANYLNIKGLLTLGCKVAANQIKDKSAEEVQQLWRIECDISPEEVIQIKRENAWAED